VAFTVGASGGGLILVSLKLVGYMKIFGNTLYKKEYLRVCSKMEENQQNPAFWNCIPFALIENGTPMPKHVAVDTSQELYEACSESKDTSCVGR
jgi:hypothetical protein